MLCFRTGQNNEWVMKSLFLKILTILLTIKCKQMEFKIIIISFVIAYYLQFVNILPFSISNEVKNFS